MDDEVRVEEGLVRLQAAMLAKTSVADPDPGSGIRCLFDPWIRYPE